MSLGPVPTSLFAKHGLVGSYHQIVKGMGPAWVGPLVARGYITATFPVSTIHTTVIAILKSI